MVGLPGIFQIKFNFSIQKKKKKIKKKKKKKKKKREEKPLLDKKYQDISIGLVSKQKFLMLVNTEDK